ncbi:hypothetical protein KSD_02120 [Ktedonobacter sp. SOSP1-85]|nr:hypothetical protein KSD_02120 [Ktedonobacter sp. SOSP1-85]
MLDGGRVWEARRFHLPFEPVLLPGQQFFSQELVQELAIAQGTGFGLLDPTVVDLADTPKFEGSQLLR